MDSRDPSDRPRTLGKSRKASERQETLMGSKYVTSALKKVARERPKLLERAAHKLFLDASGDSTEEKAIVRPPGEGEEGPQVSRYRLEIGADARHRALALIRDTLQGRPQQELRIEGAPATNVIVIHANVGEEPELPDSVKEILAAKEAGDLGEDSDEEDDDF